jgi:hypothetical protein
MGRRKDGSLFAMTLSLSEILDRGDPQRHFVGVMRDLTELEKLNDALKEKTSQLEAIFNSTVDALVTCDEESKIVAFNMSAGMWAGCWLPVGDVAWVSKKFGYSSCRAHVWLEAGRDLGQGHWHHHDRLDGHVPPQVHRQLPGGMYGPPALSRCSQRLTCSIYRANFHRHAQGDKKVMGRRLGQGRKLEAKRKDGTTFPALITLSEARVAGGTKRQFTAAMRDLSQLLNVVSELNTHRSVSARQCIEPVFLMRLPIISSNALHWTAKCCLVLARCAGYFGQGVSPFACASGGPSTVTFSHRLAYRTGRTTSGCGWRGT